MERIKFESLIRRINSFCDCNLSLVTPFPLISYLNDLTLLAVQTKTDNSANSVYQEEPSHQDLYCLPFCFQFLTETLISNNGHIQIQRRRSLLQIVMGVKGFMQLIDTCLAKLHSFGRGSLTQFCHWWSVIIDHQSLLPLVIDDWKDFLQSTNRKILFLETYFSYFLFL